MTFPKYIEDLQSRNKSLFAAEMIQMKVSTFKAQLEKAYKAGEKHSYEFYSNLQKVSGRDKSPLDIFSSILGKK